MRLVDRKKEHGEKTKNYVRTTVYLKKEHYKWVKEKKINLSGFLQMCIDREIYLPHLVVKKAWVDREAGANDRELMRIKPPIGAVLLIPKNKVRSIHGGVGEYYLLLEDVKIYIEPIGWDVVARRRYIYVYD